MKKKTNNVFDSQTFFFPDVSVRCNSRNGRTVFSFGISAANMMGRNSVGFLLEKIHNPMSHNFRSVNSNSVLKIFKRV